jgi:hypothetical protein
LAFCAPPLTIEIFSCCIGLDARPPATRPVAEDKPHDARHAAHFLLGNTLDHLDRSLIEPNRYLIAATSSDLRHLQNSKSAANENIAAHRLQCTADCERCMQRPGRSFRLAGRPWNFNEASPQQMLGSGNRLFRPPR